MNEQWAAQRVREQLLSRIIMGGIVLVVTLVLGGSCYAWPKYRVWQRELAGKAELKQAEWNRRITIEEANAKLESAKALADAEVVRAEGVARANQIIGGSLQGNEAYLRYLWIMGLQDGSSEVIYVPTEAQLPILEATRGVR